ncbi:MAG TPA: hypothetical protein VFI03_02225 [Solirubrobacterales bacterium]|nr:hypothetical protein [Solirubrobacterales bacterium]
MEAMRDLWTDERLDDLNHRVDSGFTEVSGEFKALRLEMRTEFVAVRSEMATEFGAVRSEMAAVNRTMLQIVLGGFATMLVGFAGTIAAILTQV